MCMQRLPTWDFIYMIGIACKPADSRLLSSWRATIAGPQAATARHSPRQATTGRGSSDQKTIQNQASGLKPRVHLMISPSRPHRPKTFQIKPVGHIYLKPKDISMIALRTPRIYAGSYRPRTLRSSGRASGRLPHFLMHFLYVFIFGNFVRRSASPGRNRILFVVKF